MKRVEIGEVYLFPLPDGRRGACQVTRVERSHVTVVLFDWVGSDEARLEDLHGCDPLVTNHHFHEGRTARTNVFRETAPRAFRLLGSLPVTSDEASNSYGSWWGFPHEVALQWWWDHVVPDAERSFLKACRARRDESVDLGPVSTPRKVSLAKSGVSLDLRVPGEPFDWSRLDPLGALLSLHVQGPAPGLRDYIAGRMLIRTLTWSAPGVSALDLTGTGLDTLSLDFGAVEGALRLDLDSDLTQLQLRNADAARLRVHHPGEGAGMRLRIADCEETHPDPVPGLAAITALEILKPRRVEVSRLAAYDRLECLHLFLGPGEMVDPQYLARFQRLRELVLNDCYDFDAAAFPGPQAWPGIDEVRIDGLRKEAARLLKETLKRVPALEIRGAKTDAWIAANAFNPFRDWSDDQPKMGRVACAAYKKAASAVEKLVGKGSTEDFRVVLRTFVEAFNALDEKHGLDTLHREEIGDAFHDLCRQTGGVVSAETEERWFDAWREF